MMITDKGQDYVSQLMDLAWPHAEKIGLNIDSFVDYVLWHVTKGCLTMCIEDGEVKGFAFFWRIKSPEKIEHFTEYSDGEYVYCPFATGHITMLPQVILAAKQRFPGVKYFCYQREHRNDSRVRIWDISDE